ncbi:hypothetical protein AAFF_G00296170 [Aldrovandia affinis]|uniref:Active regulator of SIRT1 n=1 Tax=Aldrovandia affinis TaxID=143900 RepID=A0AAD7SRY2_9TELE|nr:hypothetical protein AAFF_G00296170 [Aldrovandia affinis]
MSASMVRRGLELLSNDIKGVSRGKKRKAKKQLVHQTGGGRGGQRKGGVMGQISSNKQGVTKQVRRLQGRLGSGKSKATVKDKRIKCAVDEFRKKQKQSQLSKNLRYFQGFEYKAEQSDTQKILLHNHGRQSRNRPDHSVQKQREKRSLFTEEEFQQFQKDDKGREAEHYQLTTDVTLSPCLQSPLGARSPMGGWSKGAVLQLYRALLRAGCHLQYTDRNYYRRAVAGEFRRCQALAALQEKEDALKRGQFFLNSRLGGLV